MPIDNYEQYKRVINQITGRLYMHRYIGNTERENGQLYGRATTAIVLL